MSDELDDLLTGPDEGSPEPAASGAVAADGDAARPATQLDEPESHEVHQEVEKGEPTTAESLPEEHEPLAESPADTGPADTNTEELAEEEVPAKSRPPKPPIEDLSGEEKPIKKEWYILKVQSNREDSIADALQRRIAIAGLGAYFDEIIVPTEKVSEFKGGKKRVVKRKIYPGYIVVHMELNDDTWFLVRETPGIGDFTGSGGKPTPMLPQEVNKIVSKAEEKAEEEIRTVIPFTQGDRVRIKEGTFENFEGDVDNIDKANGRVTIMINIFGRSTPVELEYWQVEKL